MYFCEGMDDSPAMTRLHVKHTNATSESLKDVFKTQDWELLAQTAVWIMVGSIILQLPDTVYLYIRRCLEAVDVGGLQFISTYGQPSEFSDHLHEKFSVLSQIIYFENFLFLTCGGVEPTMSARIEKEFRHQLQVRSTTSLLFRSLVQPYSAASISGIVQDLPIDHAYAKYFAGQRHDPHTQPSSN